MEEESQLELFDAPGSGTIRRGMAPMGAVQLRWDHAVLAGIAGLIVVTVVFACGVERGKLFARAERPLLTAPAGQQAVSSSEASRASSPSASSREPANATKEKTAPPAQQQKASPPKRLASSGSTFAIQIVSYRTPELASRELKRLHATGEQAFLMKQQDKAVLFIGPFPSRTGANAKLASLKQRYRDCFIRSL